MARKLRVQYEGAIYHITCRLVGSWKDGDRELFRDDADRWRFLDSLEERVKIHGVRLYQYVLMANHFHLVIETPQANCSAFMQSLLACSPSAFITRSHRQPYRPFAAYFLTRFGGLSRREAARHLGVSSGPAVTQQIARYGRMIAQSRRLKKVAKQCEAALKDAASGVA